MWYSPLGLPRYDGDEGGKSTHNSAAAAEIDGSDSGEHLLHSARRRRRLDGCRGARLRACRAAYPGTDPSAASSRSTAWILLSHLYVPAPTLYDQSAIGAKHLQRTDTSLQPMFIYYNNEHCVEYYDCDTCLMTLRESDTRLRDTPSGADRSEKK
jgi:hypothetical protein